MAVPKKRKSHARSRTRKSHNALEPTSWVTCPQCREPMSLHRVCSHCGYYRSRAVLQTEA